MQVLLFRTVEEGSYKFSRIVQTTIRLTSQSHGPHRISECVMCVMSLHLSGTALKYITLVLKFVHVGNLEGVV